MLYDPKWEAPVKIDLSLRGLISWLETMPAEGAYIHTFGDECLLGQWLRFVDPTSECVHTREYRYIVNGESRDFSHLSKVAFGGGPKDWTFGSALKRARNAANG